MKKLQHLVFLAAALLLIATPTFADSPRSIVGTWAASVAGVPTSLFTFAADGTLTAAANTSAASGGHGVWVKTGSRSYQGKNVSFLYNATTGAAEFVLESQFDFVVSNDGNSAASPNIVVTIKLLDGTVVNTFTTSSTLSRVTLD